MPCKREAEAGEGIGVELPAGWVGKTGEACRFFRYCVVRERSRPCRWLWFQHGQGLSYPGAAVDLQHPLWIGRYSARIA
ncbi:MAG TPA: hypothetical protein DIT89_11670 [Planctomycetaceae bacterium]|nr:hypothetical protein [Planctomycetaceae bacterium]